MSAFYKTFLLSGLASGAVLTAIWIGFLGYEAIKLIRTRSLRVQSRISCGSQWN